MWSSHSKIPFGNWCVDLLPREMRILCRCLALSPTWSYAIGRVPRCWEHPRCYHSDKGTPIWCCWGLHLSFWNLVHSLSISKTRWMDKLLAEWKLLPQISHFDIWRILVHCIFFFPGNPGNFPLFSWIYEFIMKENPELLAHLCQRYGHRMTWQILQRMGWDVGIMHTDSQTDGFQMSCIKDHPSCKN